MHSFQVCIQMFLCVAHFKIGKIVAKLSNSQKYRLASGQIIKSLSGSVETAKVVVAALPEALGRFQILEWVINLGADLRIGSGTENL